MFVLLAVLLYLTTAGFVVTASWVDPDTPLQVQTTTSLNDDAQDDDDASKVYQLVFSDEFQQDGRTFHDGHDPRWTALNKNDYTNNPLHYYSHDAIHTNNGMLKITTSVEPKNFTTYDNNAGNAAKKNNHTTVQYKEVKSGMIQSWNKFCFTGGIVEFSARLPGSPSIGGLWPAIWMMGNLARATYVDSSEHIWPFSTNVCNNQTRHSQLINSCPSNDDNKYNLPNNRGRGAPEVDLLEVMIMDVFEHPLISSSLQVAPGIDHHRPIPGHVPNNSMTWYDGVKYGNDSSLNTYFYGTSVWQKRHVAYKTDAISANTYIRDDHYYRQHVYRLEWEPPSYSYSLSSSTNSGGDDGDIFSADDNATSGIGAGGGYLKWYMDGKFISSVDGEALYGTSQTEIPSEPMYLLMNTAISKDWGFPDAYFLNCKCKCWSCFEPCCQCGLPRGYCTNFPATFEIDYVRVYQRGTSNDSGGDGQHTMGCSPPLRPTRDVIEARKDRYKLPHEDEPLLPVVSGGGPCTTNDDCGTLDRGMCSNQASNDGGGTCICSASWTGPQCLAHAGSDEEEQEEQKLQDDDQALPEKKTAPSVDVPLLCAFLVVACLLAGVICLRCRRRCRHRASYEKLAAANGSSLTMRYASTVEDSEGSASASSHSSLSYQT